MITLSFYATIYLLQRLGSYSCGPCVKYYTYSAVPVRFLVEAMRIFLVFDRRISTWSTTVFVTC